LEDALIWILGLVLAAIFGVIAEKIVERFGERYEKKYEPRMGRWARRIAFFWRSSASKSGYSIRPRDAPIFGQYFKEAGAETLDVAIYELSLRPKIPLMDLLYFEYLKQRMSHESIGNLIVVPWNGRGSEETVLAGERELKDNLQRI
jgi:predicted outer membrane lipoprotein